MRRTRLKGGLDESSPTQNNKEVCEVCDQRLDRVDNYEPVKAQKESLAIKDPSVLIDGFDDEEALKFNLTNFTIYDSENHLISLSNDKFGCEGDWTGSSGFFFTGYIKRIDQTDDADECSGILTKSSQIRGHYINQRYFQVILETRVGGRMVEYYLRKPSTAYKPLFEDYYRMALLAHIVITRFEEAFDSHCSVEYDEILEYVTELTEWDGHPIDKFEDEDFHNHAKYIAQQIISVENVEADAEDKFTMKDMPAALHIIKQGGYDSFDSSEHVRAQQRQRTNQLQPNEDLDVKAGDEARRAYTTPLVSQIFGTIFEKEIKIHEQSDGKQKSEFTDEVEDILDPINIIPGAVIKENADWIFFESVHIGGRVIQPGNFLSLAGETEFSGGILGHVIQILKRPGSLTDKYVVHMQEVERENTVLEGYLDSRELFKMELCSFYELTEVQVLDVKYRPVASLEDWRRSGGSLDGGECGGGLYWRQFYCNQTARFYSPAQDQIGASCYCSRIPKSVENLVGVPSLEDGAISLGAGVFKEKDFCYFSDLSQPFLGMKTQTAETVRLPEVMYRRAQEFRPIKEGTWDPFIVIQLRKIEKRNGKVTLVIFFRPENTVLEYTAARERNISCLYLTQETRTITLKEWLQCIVTTSRPVVVTGDCEADLASWTAQNPHRFYVVEKYRCRRGIAVFEPLYLEEARGHSIPEVTVEDEPRDRVAPLATLDIFAGAGGFSKGLEESGAIHCKWAVEREIAAAKAFRLNHEGCRVFNEDCNFILEKLMEDPKHPKVKGLPQRGEVDCIIGGPPCQGFSVLNMFSKSMQSRTKNSQVANFLGYIDYYRPRFLLMENVMNMGAHDGGVVFRLLLASLVRMGYQVTSSVLQAGHYGVAQTRRRLIVIGAAPGERLPNFPEPWHVFPGNMTTEMLINNRRILSGLKNSGAPRRTITTWDILSDLPAIESGGTREEMAYKATDNQPFMSKYYFRVGSGTKLKDHISKPLSELNQARIELVPRVPGSDWRDIPNKETLLPSGKLAKELVFEYTTRLRGQEISGVCPCIKNVTNGASYSCIPHFLEPKSAIIPWWLPHTAHRRSSKWAGVYGRIPWDGIFKTTLTSPEPTGTQGQVLHPEQNRICSVREFARSQGFRDSFSFVGNINQKHRQVGNAVPPPMGKALGDEIKKVLSISK